MPHALKGFRRESDGTRVRRPLGYASLYKRDGKFLRHPKQQLSQRNGRQHGELSEQLNAEASGLGDNLAGKGASPQTDDLSSSPSVSMVGENQLLKVAL